MPMDDDFVSKALEIARAFARENPKWICVIEGKHRMQDPIGVHAFLDHYDNTDKRQAGDVHIPPYEA